MEITKSQLIELWALYCDENAQDPDMFSYYHSEECPSYGIRINDNVSLTIDSILSKKSYNITLIFSDVIRYKTFIIDEIEYEGLTTYWEAGSNKAAKIQKDKKISEGLIEFEKLFKQFQTT